MNIPKYPLDYYTSKNEFEVDNSEINEKVQECVRYLEENKEENHFYTSTGSVRIDVRRLAYRQYKIVVAKKDFKEIVI